MQELFSGVCTAMVTPLTKDLEIDFKTFQKNIDWQILNGVSALCIMGTTGEASTLSFDEKVSIIKFAINHVKHRVPIIFGIGGNNPTEILKLGNTIKEHNIGNIGVLLSTPYYNKCTQDAAIKHFHDMANQIKLPMIIYNIPGRAGMNLLPPTALKILNNPFVVGIKESSGNIAQITEIVRLCPDKAVYCGDDGLSLPCYSIGCRGIISVASNIKPQETIAIYNNRDTKLFLEQTQIYDALFCEVNPSPIKYAMSLLGMCKPYVRPPLTMLSKSAIIQYGFRKLFSSTCNQ